MVKRIDRKIDINVENSKDQNTINSNFKRIKSIKSSKTQKMVERFVESISQINDSNAFESSFEIKPIEVTMPQQTLQRHHPCVTEVDRENLTKFVRNYEAKRLAKNQQTTKITTTTAIPASPKSSPLSSPKAFCRRAMAMYQNAFIIGSSSSASNSRSVSPKLEQNNYEPINVEISTATQCNNSSQRQRSQPERSSLRSAAKLLQVFSAKKRTSNKKSSSSFHLSTTTTTTTASCSPSSSSNSSPVLLRAHQNLGCRALPNSDNEYDDEPDDGISSAGSNFTQSSNGSGTNSASRNISPDSSFEMHPPLVPSFKVTPPQMAKRNAAYEFARFLRGSFHAKRASVTKLRRSLSDPDAFQTFDPLKSSIIDGHSTLIAAKQKKAPITNVLSDSTNVAAIVTSSNCCPSAFRNRALPSNASPFRRAWGQSSYRTPRTDKHILSPNHKTQNSSNSSSPLIRRAASMTASDNDVYIKSMNGYVDELKQAQLQKLRNNQLNTTKTDGSRSNYNNTKTNNNNNNSNNGTAVVSFKTPTTILTKTKIVIADDTTTIGVATWGNSFERLLEDAAGLHTFAEFLKKEFSAENIYFWTACERYRQTEDRAERAKQAREIFNKHLANGSLEPVNVDSRARNLNEEQLKNAEHDIFLPAQKQIFNLMKFDSYQRFIRSDLYKSCQEAEEKRQLLPYRAEDLDEMLRLNVHNQTNNAGSASKLKKSASNAEDRRRKSLLPWHRKTRSKSRDRCEAAEAAKNPTTNGASNTQQQQQIQQNVPSKIPHLLTLSNSLKIPSTHNSMSDLHSSRSSLSSFDAVTANVGQLHAAEIAHSLCRVILSDGATTIVQTRANETVGQLVERLLEKRGLSYKHYDVIDSESSKSISLQSNAQANLAGKVVHIEQIEQPEQRVAFKLDLPDPKVISVKSKPKKVLHEVIRPILHKYNYDMDTVQVYVRDTHALLDLSAPVTVVDGQRLQIVLLRQSMGETRTAGLGDYQNDCSAKFLRPAPLTKSNSAATMIPTPYAKSNCIAARNGMQQSTLDEITNKVFNELLQGKVEAHATTHEKPQLQQQQSKISDMCSIKSDDCASETSSVFERSRRRDSSNIPAPRSRNKKKSIGSQNSEENVNGQTASSTPAALIDAKKPIIAKLKAGVKLQVTERVNENQDDLLEGLKRAQLARLEDQRGTEINFELPEFLKHKESISAAASKLRKVRESLSPINSNATDPSISTSTRNATSLPVKLSPTTKTNDATQQIRPQPAPRLSITNRQKTSSISPMKIDEEDIQQAVNEVTDINSVDTTSSEQLNLDCGSKAPPPLPPKPKVLPIKPSNWGASITSNSPNNNGSNMKISNDVIRKLAVGNGEQISSKTTARCAYLEEPASSFV